jgi:hypothetical protein
MCTSICIMACPWHVLLNLPAVISNTMSTGCLQPADVVCLVSAHCWCTVELLSLMQVYKVRYAKAVRPAWKYIHKAAPFVLSRNFTL